MKKNAFVSILLTTTVLMTGCVSGKYDVPDLKTELNYTREIRQKYPANRE